MTWQTAAQCEACWIEANAEWDMAVFADGDVGQKLVSLRRPHLMKAVDEDERGIWAQVEKCGTCGAPTFIGLYVRMDVPE